MVFLGNPEFGCDLHPIDFAAYARACGGGGLSVEAPMKCGDVIDHFLRIDAPAILQATVDANEPPMPAKVEAKQALHFAEALARGRQPRQTLISMVEVFG